MKILIIRPGALGDTLMLIPSLDQIRASHSVTLVGRRPGIRYAAPFARSCLDFEGMGWHTIFTDTPEVPKLPSVDIAAAFLKDADGQVKRNLQSLFPGAAVHVFPGFPQETEGIHAAYHLAKCFRNAGCILVDPGDCIEKATTRPLLRNGSDYGSEGRIIFHPGSGALKKNHAPEFWMDLILAATGHALFRGLLPTILLGPAEEGLIPFFAGRLGRERQLLVSPGPDELFSLLREGALFFGQDSGVTHLAAMLGVRTIALFRNSSVRLWRPLGPRVEVIRDENGRGDVSAVVREAEALLRTR